MKCDIAIALLTGTTILAGTALPARAETPLLSEIRAQMDPETAKILDKELAAVGAFYRAPAAPAPRQQAANEPETTGGAFVNWLREKIDIPEKPEKAAPRAQKAEAPAQAAQTAHDEEKPDAMKLVNWLRDKIDTVDTTPKTEPQKKPSPPKAKPEPAAQTAQESEKPDAMELVGWLRDKITGTQETGESPATTKTPSRERIVVESSEVIFQSPRRDDAIESAPLPEPDIAPTQNSAKAEPPPQKDSPAQDGRDTAFIDRIAAMDAGAETSNGKKIAAVKKPEPLPEKTISESLLGWLPKRSENVEMSPRSAVTRTKIAVSEAVKTPAQPPTPPMDAEERAFLDGMETLFDDTAKAEVKTETATAPQPAKPVVKPVAKQEEAADSTLTGSFIDWLMKRRESPTADNTRTSSAKPELQQRNASAKVDQPKSAPLTAVKIETPAIATDTAPDVKIKAETVLPDPELPSYQTASAPRLELQFIASYDYDPPMPLARNDGTEKGVSFHLPPYPDNAVAVMGKVTQYTVGERDTLQDIARNNGLGYVEILAANPGVDPWVPLPGTKVTVPTRKLLPRAPQEGILVNLAEMRMYHFHSKSQPPRTYPLGIGREGLQTPTGATKVIRKKIGPSWHPTERMREENPDLPKVVKAGPANPLGTHALYLGWPTFLIHGTSRPWGVGRRISSGCIRMYPEHIPVLFESVPVGTPVNIVNQTIKLAWLEDGLYLEALPTAEQSVQIEMSEDIEVAPTPDWLKHEIIKMSGKKAGSVNWKLAHDTAVARRGIPVRILDRYAPDAELETPVGELMKDDVQPQKKEQTASSKDTGPSDGRGPAFGYNP